MGEECTEIVIAAKNPDPEGNQIRDGRFSVSYDGAHGSEGHDLGRDYRRAGKPIGRTTAENRENGELDIRDSMVYYPRFILWESMGFILYSYIMFYVTIWRAHGDKFHFPVYEGTVVHTIME